MFESLEKAIQQREKEQQSKDLYYQSDEHKHFYSICKGIPFYRWEYLLNNHEAQHKHLAIIKATGLGITEFVLRWIAWMCVRNDNLKGRRVCIVTGPNIALALTLIKRLNLYYFCLYRTFSYSIPQ